MREIFSIGDEKFFARNIGNEDLATFDPGGHVHPLYSTFALVRDAEWTCRQFVLDMKDSDEEGIGTFVHVKHHSPALLGETIEFIATLQSVQGNEVICKYVARVKERIIATGEQGQKILKKEKLKRLYEPWRRGT